MKQITDLTCCRALFAGWVFAYHLNLQAMYAAHAGWGGRFVEHGALGVDGFFILSGMVLALAHPRLTPRFGEAWRFWAKRLARIYPVHLAMIGLLAVLLGAAWLLHLHPRDPGRFDEAELVRHLLLIHAWGASDRWAWDYPSWSISAEWAGYLAFPLLWPLLRRQKAMGLAVLLPLTIAGVFGAYAYAQRHDLSLTYDGGLIRFFPEFIAGMAILPLLEQRRRWPNGEWVACAGAACAVVAGAFGREQVCIIGLWFLLAGLLLVARQGRPMRLGRVPGLRWLGEISYSYYMSFAPVETVQAVLWRHFDAVPAEHAVLYAATTTVATMALAVCAWRFVERPALRAFAAVVAREGAAPRLAPQIPRASGGI